MKYLYKNITVEPYYNGYRPYYNNNGNRILLATARPTRKTAMEIAKIEVDYLNEKGGCYGEISD